MQSEKRPQRLLLHQMRCPPLTGQANNSGSQSGGILVSSGHQRGQQAGFLSQGLPSLRDCSSLGYQHLFSEVLNNVIRDS